MKTVALFDIDGTLILTGGAGGRAMQRAFSDLFPRDPVDPPALAGRTDRWIFDELAQRHGVTLDDARLAQVRSTYLTHLVREISIPHPEQRVLPGVRALLDILVARTDVCLALLTGNMAEGARIKLQHFDLWRYFAAGGFGDDAKNRSDLLADALTAVERTYGVRFEPEETVIIGDTPLDVAVAVENGARSIGVTTGSYDAAALRAAGADVVFADLRDAGQVLAALGVA